MRIVGSSLPATKRVAWLTAFRVVWGRRVRYLGASPGLAPPVPLNLTEENEELRGLCGLELSRKTMGCWVEQAAELLKPVYRAIREDFPTALPANLPAVQGYTLQ